MSVRHLMYNISCSKGTQKLRSWVSADPRILSWGAAGPVAVEGLRQVKDVFVLRDIPSVSRIFGPAYGYPPSGSCPHS